MKSLRGLVGAAILSLTIGCGLPITIATKPKSSQDFLRKAVYDQEVTEQITAFSPIIAEEARNGDLKIFFEEKNVPKNRLSGLYSEGTITLDCLPHYTHCNVDALPHELGHYVDMQDEIIRSYDQNFVTEMEFRLRLSDAQNFNKALARMNETKKERQETLNKLGVMDVCSAYKHSITGAERILEWAQAQNISALEEAIALAEYKMVFPECLQLPVTKLKGELEYLAREIKSVGEKTYFDDVMDVPIPRSAIKVPKLPENLAEEARKTQELFVALSTEAQEKMGTGRNALQGIETSFSAAAVHVYAHEVTRLPSHHDERIYEQFAAVVASLHEGYVGPVDWSPMKLTLTPPLLAYLEDFEYKGEKIFFERAQAYRKNPEVRAYWDSLDITYYD